MIRILRTENARKDELLKKIGTKNDTYNKTRKKQPNFLGKSRLRELNVHK